MKTISLLLVLLLAASLAGASPQTTHITIAKRDVAIWKPTGTAPAGGFPVILFSHGFGGCNTQSTFLMEAFAQAGYLVLAPNHQDARCGRHQQDDEAGWYPGKMLSGRSGSRPEEPFRKEEEWSESTYRDRATDMKAVLDAVLHDKNFQGLPVDAHHIGISGHSLGGYTALGMAGAWPSWKDNRIKAVLAMSPFCSPYVLKGDLTHMNVPIMYQGGSRDFGVTPSVRRLNGAYEHSSSPKYYVEFDGAGHLAWTNLKKDYHEIIQTYSLAFFDHYLRGKNDDSLASLTAGPPSKGVSYLKADVK
jgi:predicted dienelactone hydrolase